MREFIRVSIVLMFVLGFINLLPAQFTGGYKSGQSTPAEVGAGNVTSGGFAGDVSLFTGTYNSSYTLGTVSTYSGLSYTATMTHSSVYTSGDNISYASGIPYGEGWRLDLPTISVRVEDFNKYTLYNKFTYHTDQAGCTGATDDCERYYDEAINSCNDAYREGALHWMQPMLTIPGVASGRMVYKYFDPTSSRHIFVLHKFERYIEARLVGSTWEVYLDDGTIYLFYPTAVSHRKASNQRLDEPNICAGVGPTNNAEPMAKVVLPKTEYLTWHCVRITNENLVGQINFNYSFFGAFDFHKVYQQNGIRDAINQRWFSEQGEAKQPLRTVYRDVLLSEINTISGNEKLVFDYETVHLYDDSDLFSLDIRDSEVERTDSLYCSAVVKQWGGDSPTDFSNWKRYKHIATGPQNSPTNYPTPTNPYQGTGGSYPSGDGYYREAVGPGSAKFNHGFLESPRLNLTTMQLPGGDLYEIRSVIHTDWDSNVPTSAYPGCLFDINLATGDYSSEGDLGTDADDNSDGIFSSYNSNIYPQTRGESIYSTFGDAIKWYTYAEQISQGTPEARMATSNFFMMPNLPGAYKGFNIQIGPANSDNNFALQDQLAILDPFESHPNVCLTYLDRMQSPGYDPSKKARPVPANFGIGLPWYMMLDFYDAINNNIGYCENGSNGGTNFWWHDQVGNEWANVPTLADERVKLEQVQLVRHSKTPYMLKSVKKYVYDKSSAQDDIEQYYCQLYDPKLPWSGLFEFWIPISNLQFRYELERVPVYIDFEGPNGNENQLNFYSRNIFKLQRITQIHAEANDDVDLDLYPTTHFRYKNFDKSELAELVIPIPIYPFTLGGSNDPVLSMNVNSNLVVIDTIIDPLGKTTAITYDRGITVPRYNYRYRPSELTSDGQAPHSVYKQKPAYSLETQLIVGSISVQDRQEFKRWNYTFTNRKGYQDKALLSENFIYDFDHSGQYHGYEQTTVEGPIGSSGGAPKTIYHHRTSDLLWGKVFRVDTYDGENNLISKSISDYEAIIAFEPAVFRTNRNLGSWKYDYQEYRPDFNQTVGNNAPVRPLIENGGIPAYNENIQEWIDNILSNVDDDYQIWLEEEPDLPTLICGTDIDANACGCTIDEPITYGPDCGCNTHDLLTESGQSICSAYIIALQSWQETRPSYTNAHYSQSSHPDFVVHPSSFDAPIFYDSRFHLELLERDPNYMYSYFIKKIKDRQTVYDNACKDVSAQQSMPSITTITEYEYFDADYTGSSTSRGYDEFLDPGYELFWEPSFQLYRTKTYSPELPDAYSQQETFYVYDLINHPSYQQNSTGGDHRPRNEFALLWKVFNKPNLRTIPYQTRTTTKSPGETAIVQSSYYEYQVFWDPVYSGTYTETEIPHPCIDGQLPCEEEEEPPGFPDYVFGEDGQLCALITIAPSWWNCTDESLPSYLCDCGPVVLPDDDFPLPEENGGSREASEIPKIALTKARMQVEAGGSDLMTFSNNGSEFIPVFPYKNIITLKINARTRHGLIIEEENERRIKTFYNYGDIDVIKFEECLPDNTTTTKRLYFYNAVALPLAVTVGYGREDALTTRYEYNLDRTISKVIDPNGMELTYDYDGFKRMTAAYRNGEKIQGIAYHNWLNDFGQNFKTRAAENYVQTTNYVEDEGKYWGTTAYLDPLARNAANTKSSSELNTVLVEDNIYDIFGRPTIKMAPRFGSVPSIDLPGGAQAKDQAEFFYDDAPRSRVLWASKYGIALGGAHNVNSFYCLVTASQLTSLLSDAGQTQVPEGDIFFRAGTLDEDSKQVEELTNALGQKVATISGNGTVATVFKYDSHGNVKKVFNPEGQESEYVYNYLGQLYQKITVDGGTTSYGYDHSGNLVSENNANGQKRLFAFDDYGRLLKQVKTETAYDTDQGMSWVATLDVGDLESYPDYTSLENSINAQTSVVEKQWAYENYIEDFLGDYDANALLYLENSLTFTHGRLVQTISYDRDGEVIEHRFLSYTPEGFLKWEMMQLQQPQNRLVRIDYRDYNLQGSYGKQQVDLNGDQLLDFQYEYVYDAYNRLKTVYANYDDPESTEEGYKIVDYSYNDVLGVVANKAYFDSADPIIGEPLISDCQNFPVDRIIYDHDTRHRLTDIKSKLFDWKMYYDADQDLDHNSQQTSNYNGNINATRAIYNLGQADNGTAAAIMSGPTVYNYTYDNLNRLTVADAMIDFNTSIPVTRGDVNYTYDKIGNMVSLIRGEVDGSTDILKTYAYTYVTGTNKLSSVSVTGETTARTFLYDLSGNLTNDSGKGISVTYGRAHLPWEIGKVVTPTGPASSSTFLYDANDARIVKKVVTDTETTEEYYLRSASGQEIAVYDITNDRMTWYIHGNERVAKVEESGPSGFTDTSGGEQTPCDPNPPICEMAESMAQANALSGLRASMVNPNRIWTFPNKLYRLRLCDGTELHLYQEEFDLLPGRYIILQEIVITGQSQRFTISGNGNRQYQVSLNNLASALALDEAAYVNDYEPCVSSGRCSYTKTTPVREVGPSTLWSTYNNRPPYDDLTLINPGADSSLVEDNLFWRINTYTNQVDLEAEWDLGYIFDQPDSVNITSYRVFIKKSTVFQNRGVLEVALYRGDELLTINGGALSLDITQDNYPSGYTDRFVLTPDAPIKASELADMRLAIHYSGGLDEFLIDVVYPEVDYTRPCGCKSPDLDCSSTISSAQSTSRQNLQTTITNATVNGMSFPTSLYRTRLCDTSEVNVIREEMSILKGSQRIVQRLPITSPNSQFVIDWSGGQSIVDVNKMLDIRRTEPAAVINQYCTPEEEGGDPWEQPLEEKAAGWLDLTFYVHDHLGNTRVTYQTTFDCGQPVKYVIQHAIDYYPYAKVLREYIDSGDPEKYQSTHHERDQATDLDYRGARFYDSDLGRFLSLDPVAMNFPGLSPYNYVASNPTMYSDPDGRSPELKAPEGWSAGNIDLANRFGAFGNGESIFEYYYFDESKKVDNQEEKTGDMAILIAYPEDSPAIPSNQRVASFFESLFGDGDGKVQGAGHAGIVIIDRESGTALYFDFGRYKRPDIRAGRGQDQGAVRSSRNYSALRIPNWSSNLSNEDNVKRIVTVLHNSPLLNRYGMTIGALADHGLDFDAMLNYARELEQKGYVDFGGYGSFCAADNASYCAKFARCVGGEGGINFSWSSFTGAANVDDINSIYNTPIIIVR